MRTRQEARSHARGERLCHRACQRGGPWGMVTRAGCLRHGGSALGRVVFEAGVASGRRAVGGEVPLPDGWWKGGRACAVEPRQRGVGRRVEHCQRVQLPKETRAYTTASEEAGLAKLLSGFRLLRRLPCLARRTVAPSRSCDSCCASSSCPLPSVAPRRLRRAGPRRASRLVCARVSRVRGAAEGAGGAAQLRVSREASWGGASVGEVRGRGGWGVCVCIGLGLAWVLRLGKRWGT